MDETGMEDAFRVVNTLKDALKPISCIRFSPDGNRMAAGSLDGSIYIYSVLENFKLEVRLRSDSSILPNYLSGSLS
ncbi:unnamed protein product [Laminaria digitata]